MTLTRGERITKISKNTIEMGLIFGQKTTNYYSRELLLYDLIEYIDSNCTRNLKE